MVTKKRLIISGVLISFIFYSFVQQQIVLKNYEAIISEEVSRKLSDIMISSYHILYQIDITTEDKILTQNESKLLYTFISSLKINYEYLYQLGLDLNYKEINYFPSEKAHQVAIYFSDPIEADIVITPIVQTHIDEAQNFASQWVAVLESEIPESRQENIPHELWGKYSSLSNDYLKNILIKLSDLYRQK